VGGDHLCNYFLNNRYIAFCLLPQGLWFSFLIELFWLRKLKYCISFGFTHSFNFLHEFQLQKVPSLSKFYLSLHLCVYKFGVCITFYLLCIVHGVFHVLEFGFLIMLLNVSSMLWSLDSC